MVRKIFALGVALVALLVLLWVTGAVVAGPPLEGPEGDVSIAATVGSKISYQGVLKENGSPVTGNRNMVFRLYNVDSGGAALWGENHTGGNAVSVTNGLFNVTLGGINPLDVEDFDQALWLEVEVEGTILGRQRLLGAPYAHSLVPGADVRGTLDGPILLAYNDGSAITSVGLWGFSVNAAGVYGESTHGIGVSGVGHDDSIGTQGYNTGSGVGVQGYSASGHAVHAKSGGGYHAGAALEAENTHSHGIAIWAKNNSGDTTLALSNDGAGNLIKGFGGDGGEDEFRVSNDGKIETKADSYLWVPAHLAVAAQYSVGDITITPQPNGAVKVKKNTGSGTEGVFIPIAIPGVLYGQNVDVELVRIYYKCSSANSYISQTWLNKQTGASTQVVIINDPTDYKSTTDSSYSLTPSPSGLSSSEGSLNLHLGLHFANNTDTILIGGVRLRLGHHHLY